MLLMRQVVFFGSYSDIEKYEILLNGEEESWKGVMEQVINRLYDEETDFADLMESEWDFTGRKYTEYRRKWILFHFVYVYIMMRNLKRIHLLEILGASGISIDVYGNGWDSYKNQYPDYIHIHQAVDYDEALVIMADTKIVLNNMPLYVNGSHERVFTAMRCGAVSFSEENIYFREEFEENREIVFFNYKNLGSVPKKIKFLLEHEELVEYIAESGREKAEAYHTWEARAGAMLDILLEIKEMQKKPEKLSVPVHSTCDENFNRLFFLVQTMDEETVFEMMKESLIGCALFEPEVVMAREKSFSTYPYWGKLYVAGDEFEHCRQRAHQMKSRTKEFIWLY